MYYYDIYSSVQCAPNYMEVAIVFCPITSLDCGALLPNGAAERGTTFTSRRHERTCLRQQERPRLHLLFHNCFPSPLELLLYQLLVVCWCH